MSSENYIVSARKYRPSTFKSVVGQLSLVTTLKNAILSGKLAHAYLFCGPRGVGKTTCARIFAKTINCFNPTPDGEACNGCESCVSFNEQRSFNIHELDAASNNGVDHIRELTEQVRIPPQIGRYKLYIIDEVHMLSPSAFNAFLKTLEEPPQHAIFILATTEKHKIIPTILSRCQIYDFSRISVNDTVEHLQHIASQEGITAEVEALNVIAQKADGGMRDALSIFDQVVSYCGQMVTYRAVIDNLNVLDYDYYFRLVDHLNAGQIPQSLLLLDEIMERGFDLGSFVTGLASHLRDVMVSKDSATLQLLECAEAVKEKYRQQGEQSMIAFLYKGLELVNECDLNFRVSKNKRLSVELCLIRLAQLNAPQLLDSSSDQKKKVVLSPIFAQMNEQPAAVSSPSASGVGAAPEVESPPVPQSISISQPPPKSDQEQPSVHRMESTVSIRRKRVEQQQEKAREEERQHKPLNEPFTLVQLQDAWRSFEYEVREELILCGIFHSYQPQDLIGFTFSVMVDGPLQESKLLECKPRLLSFLSEKLCNNKLDFEIRMSNLEEAHRFFTPAERYQALLERQSELKHYKDVLGLDLV